MNRALVRAAISHANALRSLITGDDAAGGCSEAKRALMKTALPEQLFRSVRFITASRKVTSMRALKLFLTVASVAILTVALNRPATAQPGVMPMAQTQNAGEAQEVGYYRYRRYGYRPYYRRYGYYRPYYRPYYQPYYGYYGYRRPYYGYGYRRFWGPSIGLGFRF